MRLVTHPESTSTNSMSNAIAVPRLRDDGANWPDYQSKDRTAMGARGLIRHVDGTVRKLVAYPLVDGILMKAPGTKATDEDLEEKEKKLDDYEQKDYSAQH